MDFSFSTYEQVGAFWVAVLLAFTVGQVFAYAVMAFGKWQEERPAKKELERLTARDRNGRFVGGKK